MIHGGLKITKDSSPANRLWVWSKLDDNMDNIRDDRLCDRYAILPTT